MARNACLLYAVTARVDGHQNDASTCTLATECPSPNLSRLCCNIKVYCASPINPSKKNFSTNGAMCRRKIEYKRTSVFKVYFDAIVNVHVQSKRKCETTTDDVAVIAGKYYIIFCGPILIKRR